MIVRETETCGTAKCGTSTYCSTYTPNYNKAIKFYQLCRSSRDVKKFVRAARRSLAWLRMKSDSQLPLFKLIRRICYNNFRTDELYVPVLYECARSRRIYSANTHAINHYSAQTSWTCDNVLIFETIARKVLSTLVRGSSYLLPVSRFWNAVYVCDSIRRIFAIKTCARDGEVCES